MNEGIIKALSEIPLWSLIFITLNVISFVLIVYSKQIKAYLVDDLLASSKKTDKNLPDYTHKHLMDELIELKQLNRDLAKRIQELEIIISSNEELLDIMDTIQNDKNKVSIQGIGLVVVIERNLRLGKTAMLKNLLNTYASFLRKLEYSDRRLTIDLTKTEFINSWAIMEIAHFFLEVGRMNGIQLKVICANKTYTRPLYENLKKLEKQFESDCAIAVLVEELE